jgi:hypothetical protein
MAGVVHIPWYATLFRGEKLEKALQEIAPIALRYGATAYDVYRSRDDEYKFLQLSTFEHKHDWDRYWLGEEFSTWRADYTSYYQIPLTYVWNDLVASGHVGQRQAVG